MNDSRYKIILYIIIAVIVSTIGIQVYWNYKNYESNKQQLVNDVQTSLDNAIDTYYANLAEKSTFNYVQMNTDDDFFENENKFDSIIRFLDLPNNGIKDIDTIIPTMIKGLSFFQDSRADSVISIFSNNHTHSVKTANNNLSRQIIINTDSITNDSFKLLTTKVIISIAQDTLNLITIDSLVKQEIFRKKLDVNFGLSLHIAKQKPQLFNEKIIDVSLLNAFSKSTFLPNNSKLEIHFTNTTKEILKRILTGILLSTLLILAVISCLFYLLKIIKQQKQIAEVKNDFISNITHEFKTPIATISVALESIKDFNVINDTEKTKSYLEMSNMQLKKLNVMVEKLLETASLDSENLQLKKEHYNVVDLIQNLVTKHSLKLTDKSLSLTTISDNIQVNIDAFHFENAINNIIDNAIKYGGKNIKISIKQNTVGFTVSISDDGSTLTKANKDKIFEKFYRIPKGNTHDIKGFGIGLYYAKKIIEKHDGAIHLNLDNNWTTFNITVPNE